MIFTRLFCPISKQQANAFAIVCAANTFRDRRSDIDGHQFGAALAVRVLWDGICYLRALNDVYYI